MFPVAGVLEGRPIRLRCHARKQNRVGWYRFKAPPGLHSMRLNVKTRAVQSWIDSNRSLRNGEVNLKLPRKAVSQVALRVHQEPGYYAVAAFPIPSSSNAPRPRSPSEIGGTGTHHVLGSRRLLQAGEPFLGTTRGQSAAGSRVRRDSGRSTGKRKARRRSLCVAIPF